MPLRCFRQGWAQDAQEFRLDSALEDIQWVTKEVVYILSAKGTLYRSKDSGRNWEEQSQKLDHAKTTSKTGGLIRATSLFSIPTLRVRVFLARARSKPVL